MANAYFYSNTAVETELTGGITSGATSMTVLSTTGYPSAPFVVAIDYGAAAEELVKVTAVVAATFTIQRGFGSTSAQSHSLGAKVRHVANAVDLTDFRTHEAATSAHGVTGDIVGTGGTQTLSGKTLTSPTITGATHTGGGSMSGTFTGTPIFSGNVTFSATPSFTGSPSFSGSPVFSGLGAPVFQGNPSAAIFRGGGDTQPRLAIANTGVMTWGPGGVTATDTNLYRDAAGTIATDGILRTYGASASANALSLRVNGDSSSRLLAFANGELGWGNGTSAVDTNLYRSATSTLRTDDNFIVGQTLSAGNIAIGVSSVTPVASTPTSFNVSGLGLVPGTYRAFVCASTSAPGTVQEVTANSVTNDGFVGWIYRTSTTVTSVQWLLIGA